MRRVGWLALVWLVVQCAPAPRSDGYVCSRNDECEPGRTCEAGWCVLVVAGDLNAGGDQATGDPVLGDPVLGDPVLGDPVLGDPALGDPALGDPALGDPALGDPALGDPVPGDPALADGLYCLPSGHGQLVRGGVPIDAGLCPLGCDEGTEACRVPSNVSASLVVGAAGGLDATGHPNVTIDSDTGEILGTTTIRPAGTGVDVGSGIGFEQVTQSDGATNAGVFSVGALDIPDGTTVTVIGSRPLVILASDVVEIAGTIDIGAEGMRGGAGGFSGGAATLPGGGDCGGVVGEGTSACPALCGTGSSGGGHGTLGGDGGPVIDYAGDGGPLTYDTPQGGGVCGNESLIPLVGGSGGAGGATNTGHTYVDPEGPGAGGGGGGAIQITSAVELHIAPTGVITAPGDGGGEAKSAPGAGGGAGGAILLEAPTVTVDTAGVLAANGGGGGGGDCT